MAVGVVTTPPQEESNPTRTVRVDSRLAAPTPTTRTRRLGGRRLKALMIDPFPRSQWLRRRSIPTTAIASPEAFGASGRRTTGQGPMAWPGAPLSSCTVPFLHVPICSTTASLSGVKAAELNLEVLDQEQPTSRLLLEATEIGQYQTGVWEYPCAGLGSPIGAPP